MNLCLGISFPGFANTKVHFALFTVSFASSYPGQKVKCENINDPENILRTFSVLSLPPIQSFFPLKKKKKLEEIYIPGNCAGRKKKKTRKKEKEGKKSSSAMYLHYVNTM